MQGVAGVQSAHAVRDDVNARLGFGKAKAGYLGGQRLGPHLDGAEHRHPGKAGAWKRRANSAKVVLPETALRDEEAGREDQVHHHQILAAQTAACVGPLGISAIASLIRDDLSLTLAQAGSFLSAYYIVPVFTSLPAGMMADRWGVKRTLSSP